MDTPAGMVTYLTDITHDLTSMPEEWAVETMIAVKKIAAADPVARYEVWTRNGHTFVRVVRRRYAENIVRLLEQMSTEWESWRDMPPGTCTFAILDARYEVADGIPPHLTHSRGASRASRR